MAGGARAAVEHVASPTLEDRWDALLSEYVRPGRIGAVELHAVDYTGIAADPRWPDLLAALRAAPAPTGRQEQLAFWLNAYNILAIQLVVDNYPVKSIKDIGGLFRRVWDVRAGEAAGGTRSLGEIEHNILRPMGDARVHAGIVCASVSCPPLRREAYRDDRLDEQLDDQMRQWLENPETGARLEDNARTLRVSWIFTYFRLDFEKDGQSLDDFLRRHLPASIREELQPNARIKSMNYDWSLNDVRRFEE